VGRVGLNSVDYEAATKEGGVNPGFSFMGFSIDRAGLDNLISQVLSGYGWVFEWGMFLFLFIAIAEVAWIFIDSTQKKKAHKALAPRIVSLVGLFLILPAFIFRYTGTANGVTLRVQLLGEPGQPFYPGPISWNVKWLVAGYGPKIALLAMIGMAVSTLAVILYASTVSRSRPSTEFVSALNNQFGQMHQEIQSVKSRPSVPTSAPTVMPGVASAPPVYGQTEPRRVAATVIDREQPSAATVIERTDGAQLRVVAGGPLDRTWRLPQTECKIGRDTNNLVSIDDNKASREHAKIRFADGVYALVDLGSSNGTYLNDKPVSGQIPLNNGDLIRIGDTVLAFSNGS
jgi:hypothetical protein